MDTPPLRSVTPSPLYSLLIGAHVSYVVVFFLSPCPPSTPLPASSSFTPCCCCCCFSFSFTLFQPFVPSPRKNVGVEQIFPGTSINGDKLRKLHQRAEQTSVDGMDGRTDGWMDGRMDGERRRRPEGVRESTSNNEKRFSKGHRTQRSILTRSYRRISRN